VQLLKNHHYLLCTLVLWNAAAMEALPLFLDKLADPVTAVILSVTIVLIFGAYTPPTSCASK
jgi:metal transporter CNNM